MFKKENEKKVIFFFSKYFILKCTIFPHVLFDRVYGDPKWILPFTFFPYPHEGLSSSWRSSVVSSPYRRSAVWFPLRWWSAFIFLCSIVGICSPTNKNRLFQLATLPQDGGGESCWADVGCCVFFAHAWIFYQRRLIRIKCLKAFLTPGDVNAPWLDLQTKQPVMMQACVKTHAAVKQQIPSLDVFINVFSSSFHHAFLSLLFAALDPTLCLFLQRCGGTPRFF